MFIFFKNVILSGPVVGPGLLVRQDCKLQHCGNKKGKQMYLNIKHSPGQLEEFWDFDHLFSNIFDLFESKMKMNQSKY